MPWSIYPFGIARSFLLAQHHRPGVLNSHFSIFFFFYRAVFFPSPATIFSFERTKQLSSARSRQRFVFVTLAQRATPPSNSRDSEPREPQRSHVTLTQSISEAWGRMVESWAHEPIRHGQRPIESCEDVWREWWNKYCNLGICQGQEQRSQWPPIILDARQRFLQSAYAKLIS